MKYYGENVRCVSCHEQIVDGAVVHYVNRVLGEDWLAHENCYLVIMTESMEKSYGGHEVNPLWTYKGKIPPDTKFVKPGEGLPTSF